jgi:hypothetical protein
MMVVTCSWARYRPEMGEPIRITVGKPKNFPYPYVDYLPLAPFGLLKVRTDAEFAIKYRAKLGRVGAEAYYNGLVRVWEEVNREPLVLLCYERYPEQCHRGVFSEWFREQTGIEIAEA